MRLKKIDWERIAATRWLTAAEGAAYCGFCEEYFLTKVAPALLVRQLPGVRKRIYDRHEIDRFMEVTLLEAREVPPRKPRSKPRSTE